MAFDSTVSGASANSYISVAEADAYFEGRLYTTEWDNASLADQEKALRMATTELDPMDWKGTMTDTTTPQALSWPRSGVYDSNGLLLASDEIPVFLINATSELALSQLVSNRYAEDDAVGLRKVTAGEVAISWDRRWQNTRNPITVNQMISPYLLFSSSANYTLLNRA